MMTSFFRFKYLFICIIASFIVCCVLTLFYLPSGGRGRGDECDCRTSRPEQQQQQGEEAAAVGEQRRSSRRDGVPPGAANLERNNNPPHLLGVVVPFRNRFEELLEFGPHLHTFLSQQNLPHNIYIINQVDQYRFNRASLINAGFLLASSEGCDYMAMHDVDLLPLSPALSYSYPEGGLRHLASPEYHPRYHYPNFVGGILIIKKEDFLLVNGMSNKYWGWGLEDDEFYLRLKEANLNITRPSNLTTGIQNTFRHIHDRVWRKRDMAKCYNQKEASRRRDRQTGLADLKYTIVSRHSLTVERASLSVVNVQLVCNRSLTPWCLCSSEERNKNKAPVQLQQVLPVLQSNVKKPSRRRRGGPPDPVVGRR